MHQILTIIEKDTFGYYAHCPALEGYQTQGDSLEEVEQNIKEAISLYLSTLTEEEKKQLFEKELTAMITEVQVA